MVCLSPIMFDVWLTTDASSVRPSSEETVSSKELTLKTLAIHQIVWSKTYHINPC